MSNQRARFILAANVMESSVGGREVGRWGGGNMNLFWNQIITPLLSIKTINLMRGMKEEGREGTYMKMFWRMI